MMASVEATIEIFENQRAWIGGGFSFKGLLPNDRKRYSSTDGSLSFHTIDEIADGLITRGWCIVPNSTFEVVSSDWLYASDFSRTSHAHATRNRAFHWVRFRLLSCPIQLDPNAFSTEPGIAECDHADSVAVQTLTDRFVDVCTYLTLLAHPSTNNKSTLEDAVVVPIKKRILALIDVSEERKRFSSPSVRLEHILRLLDNLAIEERRMAKHLLSSIGSFEKRSSEPSWLVRRSLVLEQYWSEGNVLAGWIIRLIDPEYEFHCGVEHCGDTCEFRWVSCPNPGCSIVISQKYLDGHNESCPYKVIICECGESVPKREMRAHLENDCALRDTKCPFERLGCTRVLQARYVSQHVEEASGEHLVLAMNRIVEIQDVVRQMNSKLKSLQEENAQLRSSLEQVEKRSMSDFKGLDKSLNNTIKRVHGLESSTQKEFRKIHTREKEERTKELK